MMKRLIAFLQALVLCVILSAPFSVCASDTAPDAKSDISDIVYDGTYPAVDAVVLEASPADSDAPENAGPDITDTIGIIGLSDDDYVTRAQAIYVLVSALGDEMKAVMPADLTVFADYDDIDPKYSGAIGLAVSLGAVCGSDDACIHPNDYITRVEVFAIVSRILSQSDLPSDLDSDDSPFTDVPEWAAADITRLRDAGLVRGYGDGRLGSDDYMTYGQVNTVCGRLSEFMDSIPYGSIYKDDYYAYVNDQWLSETRLPDGYAKWSNIEQISQSNSYRVQKIISEIITDYYIGNEPAYGSNEQKILDIYRAAANTKYRDDLGISPIEPYLERIDSIRTAEGFMTVMAELEKCGVHSLLPITVNNDFKDSTKYSLSFEACYTGMTTGVIQKDSGSGITDLYKNYIRSLFIASGQSPTAADRNAEDVTELCIKLGEASMDSSDWDNPSEIYNVYDMRGLSELFSSVNISDYLRKLGYKKIDNIVIYDKGLAYTINRVLAGESVNTLKNYLRAALLDYFALYLNSEMFGIYQAYIDGMSGMNSDLTPDAYAVTITQAMLPLEIGEEYVARYFSADSKKQIEDLADTIIKTFEKRIRELDWLSEETREVAVEKLEAISVRIGYPDYIINYQNHDYNVRSIDDGGNLVEYLIDYNKIKSEQDAAIINDNVPVNKDNWTLSPQSVNAYYDRANNCIVIPAGILQAPYYSPNASFESNLGGIGSVIAHEITHAFDNVGSQFDKNGNLSDWWQAEDFAAFNDICKKFVSEYEKIEFMDGCFVDGRMTLSENIADIGAMACILDIAGENNPNLDELFKTYARTYRCVITDEYSRMLLLTDEHAPNKVRVNMVLSNFEAFLKLYNIKEGDKMYRAPEDRLSIW